MEFQRLPDLIAAMEAGVIAHPPEWIRELHSNDVPIERDVLLADLIATLDHQDSSNAFCALVKWYGRIGFVARPYKLLDAEQMMSEPQQIWRMLHLCWSRFFILPHSRFKALFGQLQAHWRPDYLYHEQAAFYSSLPERITIFRGQSEDRDVGISWSLDRNVAERYAIGHFLVTNTSPVVIEARIRKQEIATVGVGFKESEVVIFDPIAAERRRVLSVGL